MGPPQAPPQESTVDRAPLLRRLPPHPGPPVDLRRPRQRRLPPPLRLDTDRPARTGPRQVLTRRSCPGPLLGRPEAQEQTPAAGPVLGTAYSRPTRTLPGLRAAAAAHRPATRLPQPVGAVVPHGAQGLDPPRSDPRQPPDDPPSRAHLLRPQPHQRAQQDHPDTRRSPAPFR